MTTLIHIELAEFNKTARNLKRLGVDLQIISEATGLSIEAIDKL